VPDAVLEILAEYRQRGFEVWLELGLQSAHDETLRRINRRHDFAAYVNAVSRARHYGIPVCAHLIIGLPGESEVMCQQTHTRIVELGVEGIKLHPLMIVRGSGMAAQYVRGELSPPLIENYAATVADLIRRTPSEVVFHRVTATAREPTLIAPDWCHTSWPAIHAICQDLMLNGIQGYHANQ
jgi:radical SAM protein (TIGR01212 family)